MCLSNSSENKITFLVCDQNQRSRSSWKRFYILGFDLENKLYYLRCHIFTVPLKNVVLSKLFCFVFTLKKTFLTLSYCIKRFSIFYNFLKRTWLIKLFEFGSTKSQRQINTANLDVRNQIKTISAFLLCQNIYRSFQPRILSFLRLR